MEKMNEVSKFKALSVIALNAGEEDLAQWANKKAEQAEAKAQARSAKTEEAREARKVIAETVLAYMEDNPGDYTATELSRRVPNVGDDCSTSKMTSYLTLLKEDGKVTCTKTKGVNRYTLA